MTPAFSKTSSVSCLKRTRQTAYLPRRWDIITSSKLLVLWSRDKEQARRNKLLQHDVSQQVQSHSMIKSRHSKKKINLQEDGWERQDAIGEAGSRETKQQVSSC
jgi:hypothetical protein